MEKSGKGPSAAANEVEVHLTLPMRRALNLLQALLYPAWNNREALNALSAALQGALGSLDASFQKMGAEAESAEDPQIKLELFRAVNTVGALASVLGALELRILRRCVVLAERQAERTEAWVNILDALQGENLEERDD
jgi:hypothetical protein